MPERYANYALKKAKQLILGLGNMDYDNDFIELSLNDFILKNMHLCSFDLLDEVHT